MPPRSTSTPRPAGRSESSASPGTSRSDGTVGRHQDPPEDRATPGAGQATVDLHTHTLRSDGILTPVELVRAAAEAGVTTLAITDHDTLAGVRDLVLGRAMPAPIELVTGVEINALARGIPLQDGELHILGFGMG